MQNANTDHILKCVSSINEGMTPEHVFNVFVSAARKYGFEHVALAHLTDPLNMPPKDIFHFSTWPQELIENRIKTKAILEDPIARCALKTQKTFSWADAAKHATTAGHKVMDVARDYGLEEGYLFPMHPMDGVSGAVSLGSKCIAISSDEIAELEFICSAAYYRLESLQGASIYQSLPDLSTREAEVLQLVSGGKLNTEIAVILGIQEDTVKKHLVSAREKLGAVNRTHAVSKAIASGQIFP